MEPVPSPTSLPPEPTPTSTTEPLVADIVAPVIPVTEQSYPDKTVGVPELQSQTAVEDEAAQLLLGLVGGAVAIVGQSDASMDVDQVTGQSAASQGDQQLEPVPTDEVSTERVNGPADAAPASGGDQPVVQESTIEEIAVPMSAEPDSAVKPPAPVSTAGDEPATDEPTTAAPPAPESLPLAEAPAAAVPMDVDAQSATQEAVASALVSLAEAGSIPEPVRESSPVRSQQYLSPLPPHTVPFNSTSPNSLAHLLHPQPSSVAVPAPPPSLEVPRQADIAPLQIHMIPAKPISPPIDPPQSSVSFALPADQPQPVASTSYIPPTSGQNEPPNAARPVKKRKRAQPQNPRRTSGSKATAVEPPAEDGVIRCVCMFPHDDGFTIQCDHCQTWQHAVCMGIAQDDVPEIYRCDRCSDRKVDQKRAMTIQMEWIENEKRRRDAEGSQPVRGGKTATRGRLSKGDREGSRGRVGSMALDDVDMGDGSGRERASPAASASSAMPPPVTTTKGKRRGAQPKQRAKSGKEHPTSIENFPSPFATSASASSAAFKEPSTPASVQAQIQALSAGEDEIAWKAEAWRLEYTDVKANVIRGRGVHQAIRSFLDEWLGPEDSPVVDQKKKRRRSGSLQDASGLPSPAEPGHGSLTHATDLPPPDFTSLGPPIPPVYLAGVSLTSIASATVVKTIQEASSFLPLGYTANPSAPHSVTAPAYLSSAVFTRPRTFGVFADQPVSADAFIGEYKGEILQAEAYRRDPINQYSGLGMPKPYVHALGPPVDLMIDARGYGSELRFIRSGCHPNVVIRPTLFRATGIEGPTTLVFGVFATRPLVRKEELVLGWEWDDQHVVHFLDVLSRCRRLENGRSHLPAIHPVKLRFILDKIETILTSILGTFTTCACTIPMNCAVAQMAHLVETGGSLEGLDALGKGGKPVDLGELVGATRGWRRLEEEIERMVREEMLLAQEFQRREMIRRREEQPSEDEEEEVDEDEEKELPTLKADVPASIEVDEDSPSSPVKLTIAVKDFAGVPKSLTHPASSPISSAGSTPKAVKTALNGVPGLISTAVEDGEDSGEASDTSTLTQPLSHRSFDSEESDRDDSDALSEPPAPSSPHVRVVRNRIDSGDETEEDEAPLRRHGKIVAKVAAKAPQSIKTPQGLKQSQSKLAGKTKVNGVKKVRRILSPTVPLSPQLPLSKPWDKASGTKIGAKKSQLASVPQPRKSDAMDVDEPEVKAPVVEVKPPVTIVEGGRTPTGPIAPLPEMPLPDVPVQALNSIFDEPMPAHGDQQPLGEGSPKPEPELEPEHEPEPVPEPVKQPAPPVRRLTLADYAARRKVAPTEGELTKTDEPVPPVVTAVPAIHDTPSVETSAPAPAADFVSGSSSAAAAPHIDIPFRVESSVKADPSPAVNPSLESVEESKPVDSPLQLSPVRKLSESGAFDWSRHLPSSSAYAAHLPTETREASESKPEASWQISPRYDGFRSLSSGSTSAPLAEANNQPSAEPRWNPRPVWAQQEVKQASPPSRPPPLPHTPATAPVGLDLDLERPSSPSSPPFVPRSRPPPPLMQRDLPPHQQPGGMPPRYPPAQESPVMQRTPLPPPGPRTSWPSSVPPKEPPRGPRGWHAGQPHSPSNGLGHVPHRAPTTPSPGYGQPSSGRGGYGPPRGPSSEYRGSRPWSRGRARGRWMA